MSTTGKVISRSFTSKWVAQAFFGSATLHSILLLFLLLLIFFFSFRSLRVHICGPNVSFMWCHLLIIPVCLYYLDVTSYQMYYTLLPVLGSVSCTRAAKLTHLEQHRLGTVKLVVVWLVHNKFEEYFTFLKTAFTLFFGGARGVESLF